MLVCDAHCHLFSPVFFTALARETPDLPKQGDPLEAVAARLGWEATRSPEGLADRWVRELDRHGVGRAALIASVAGDEASAAAAVARHPSRLVGFFMVDPTQKGARRTVSRALGRLGLRAACLYPAMHRYRLDSEPVRQVFLTASRRPGAAVFVHCGYLSVGVRGRLGLASPFDFRLGQPLDLLPVLRRFPGVPVILPHFGAGYFREALMLAASCPNVHFDTSSSNAWLRFHPGLDLAGVFRHALEVVGPDRLLFGTDSSFFPRGWQRPVFEEQARVLEAIGASEIDREKIFGGNFERLFGGGVAD